MTAQEKALLGLRSGLFLLASLAVISWSIGPF